MKQVAVTIEGTTPILLHNPAGMARKTAGKTNVPTPEDEAEASKYWLDDKSALAFPADNIKGSMIVTSGGYKSGKTRIGPYVAGSVYIEPPMVSFGTKECTIDTRRAVVVKQGILRSRARLDKWKLNFDLIVDDDFPVTDLKVLRDILEESGRRVGIGDFRPAKKGWFGKFKVVRWHEKKA